MWTKHYMMLKSQTQRLKLQNQLLSGFSSFNTQNSDYWNSTTFLFTTLCDVNKLEDLEMVTNSPYSALAEKELEDCIRPEMKAQWKRLLSTDCTDKFTADVFANFFHRGCCEKNKKHDKRSSELSKEDCGCTKMLCLCSKTYCSYDVTTNKLKFRSKRLKKGVLQQSGDGTLEKIAAF